MLKGKQKRRRVITILLITGLLVAGAGSVLNGGGGWETTRKFFGELCGTIVQAVPPENGSGNEPDSNPPGPGVEPDVDLDEPGPEPEDNPDHDAGEPGENPEPKPDDPPNRPETVVIYPGQTLLIPGKTGSSRVIDKGAVETGKQEIALTIDSGWLDDQTLPLLDLFDRYRVQVTFFPRALWVQDHPDLALEIVRRGHTMGNHSLTHPHMREMTSDEMRHELRESNRIIEAVTGVEPYLFRPPYGEYNQELLDVLGETGFPYTIMWTVDTHDWAETLNGVTVTTDYIVRRVLDNACPGGIILMHIAFAKTVQALPQIIEGLSDRGYTFTTVDRMMPPPGDGPVTHTVHEGETLYGIARSYGIPVETLIRANNLR